MTKGRTRLASTHLSDVTWVNIDDLPLPDALADWLTDEDSLTLKLQRYTGQFNVRVLRHEKATAQTDEVAFMQTAQHNPDVQVREVLLCDEERPWVFARSIIPQHPSRILQQLQDIGEQPLGQILFTHPDVVAGPFQVARFGPSSQIGRFSTDLTGSERDLWARRRNFWLADQAILVAEVFLPNAPCYDK
ncbi:hypothetical protein CWE14_05600 [Aliidiomarina soli]|uniref:Probable chorismate pyruvate-lyase n=1 Tax=Aliidiomarina soli TaxID=1928574 RepID=A0A432WJP9_9GAMM|nr:hypothetical protein CWE14_05600 [Aliidiomarina soli]